MSQTFTLADVQSHNKTDNLWIVVDGDVYDLTNFQEEHPGGKKILQRVAGKDASKQFWKYHNAHILEKYRSRLQVGSLDTKAKPNAPPTPPATPPSDSQTPAPVPTEGDKDKGGKTSAPPPSGGSTVQAPVPTEEDVNKTSKEKERPKWSSVGAYGPAPDPAKRDPSNVNKGTNEGGKWSSVGAYGPAPTPTEKDKAPLEKPSLYGRALPEPKPLKSKL